MLIKQDFRFESLDAVRTLHIRIPDRGEGPFPVFYFFDGHNLFRDEDATYGKSWGLDDYCNSWDKQLIIVGIESPREDNTRLSEYLPYSSRMEWLKDVEPRGEATMRGILDELKPYIDSNYATIPFRECTAIGGSSMGGLMAVYALAKYNDKISKAACLSPSVGTINGKLWHLMNNSKISPDTRLYMSWGTLEGYDGIKDPWVDDKSSVMYKSCRGTANKVIEAGGTAKLYCQIGGRHNEEDWGKQLGTFMPFLWQNQ